MQQKYRIGVIGHTGRGDYGHAVGRAWLQVPGCRVVGVADPNSEGLAQAVKRLRAERGFADYREMLDTLKPDVVSICPRWLDQHHALARAAIDRGIHVLMEKPFCRSLEEADDIVRACEKNQVKLAIAFQTRYSPRLQAVRNLLDDGRIGRLLELRGRGKEDQRGGGEDLWVLGSHIMNLMRTLAGEAKWCFGRILQDGRPISAGDIREGNEGIGPLAGDTVNAMYGMDAGVTAYFGSHRNVRGNRFGLQLFGSMGVIEMLTGYLPAVFLLEEPTWSPGRGKGHWRPVSSAGVDVPEPYPDLGLLGGNIEACRDLLDAIEEDRLPEANVYEARNSVAMIAAVFESQRTGGSVSFPLKTRKNPLALPWPSEKTD